MTAHTPEDPIEADPMLRVLRERHPEVEIVLLPGPVAPDRPATPLASPADLAGLAREVDDLLDSLVSRLARHQAWPADPAREARWRHEPSAGARSRFVHREVVVVAAGLAEGDNVALLRATGNALLGLGWDARPVAGSAPRLVARRGAARASALVRPGSLQVVVTSGHVLTDAEDLS
ncbi:hypothetical protein EXE58_15270 [Nocardioides seonyuensis]|uniref:Uncharacterized protein n=1 Tax=Nocardioides seonyuensis TaxID=2518371 RepID=A0A4P7IH97_9ACTN|nr:hypothetical protein [Nocardioides seonyuensis]QBX56686.1 hypothetical protein EXE58_15270 [Nocardioides seonyuensis]